MVAALSVPLPMLLLSITAMMCSWSPSEGARSSRENTSTPQRINWPVFPGGSCSDRKEILCRKEVLVGRGDDVEHDSDFYNKIIGFDICAAKCETAKFISPYHVDDWARGLWTKFLSFRSNIEIPTHETVDDFATLAHFIDGIWAEEKSTFKLFDDWINSPRGYVENNVRAFMKRTSWKDPEIIDRFKWDPYEHQPWKGKQVLIVGAGPVGLRMAIEARLLGADVFVCEARTVWIRGNVMKMWKVAKSDLDSIGLKDWSIMQGTDTVTVNIALLQHALLRIALVLGATVHINMPFERLQFNQEYQRYGAIFKSNNKELPPMDFDAIFDATGIRGAVVSQELKVDGPEGVQRRPLFQRTDSSQNGKRVAITANFERFDGDSGKQFAFGKPELIGTGAMFRQYLSDFFLKKGTEPEVELTDLVYFKSTLSNYVVMALDLDKMEAKAPNVFKNKSLGRSEKLRYANIDYQELLEKIVMPVAREWQLPVKYDSGQPLMLTGINKLSLFDFMGGMATKDPESGMASLIQPFPEAPGGEQWMLSIGDTLRAPFWPEGTGMSRGLLSVYHAGFVLNKIWTQGNVAEALAQAEKWAHLSTHADPQMCQGGKCTTDRLRAYVQKGYSGVAPPARLEI